MLNTLDCGQEEVQQMPRLMRAAAWHSCRVTYAITVQLLYNGHPVRRDSAKGEPVETRARPTESQSSS